MRSVVVFMAFVGPVGLFAQISHGGAPYGWGLEFSPEAIPVSVQLDPLSEDELLPVSAETERAPFRYGTQRFVSVDVLAEGSWTTLPDDRRVCRVAITSPGAAMLSVQFDRFDLAPDARVYLYDAARSRYIGGFTNANHLPSGDLATAVVPGEVVVIEYEEPIRAQGTSQLHVASITHGFIDLFDRPSLSRDYDPGIQSLPCHNNVVCPIANGWDLQVSSVAMYLRPDGFGCTGTMLNNTAQNGAPYLYTANHCYTLTTSQWVFYFNYESPTCVGDTGPTTDVVTGCTPLSFLYITDHLLVELSSPPPPSYGVAYSGWDRSGNNPTQQTVIEHPINDVKKIAFDLQPATSVKLPPHVGAPDSTNCWMNFWNSGIVEGGASGAPLFDQNKRVIGSMWEGAQNCSNAATVGTACAKLSAAWNGTAPNNRLRDWLDPSNTVLTLDGYDPTGQSSPPILVNVKAFLQGPFNTTTNRMNTTLRASGLIPLLEPYTDMGYTHVGGGGEVTTQAVLNVTGTNAVVDWVVVELRDKLVSTQVVATKSGLMLSTGAIVDPDGVSPLSFALPADDYYIAVRHRNHLGIMTQAPRPIGTVASLVDMSSAGVPLYTGSGATIQKNGLKCMWSGNARKDAQLKYTGSTNDRDAVLLLIGGVVPTGTVAGYHPQDVDLDGVVKYTGANNDRDIILQNVGATLPTNIRQEPLP